ncbi:MAG TPA: hypothetical protein VMR52_06840 [Dehalococcoidia bacterium]|nr:hypothetical protein [Dehalococcoidia bacterium]
MPTPNTSLRLEASTLLRDIVSRLADGTGDVVFAARTSFHAASILGWNDAAAWFRRELAGYGPDEAVPAHRHVVATVRDRPHELEDLMEQAERKLLSGLDGKPVRWQLKYSLDQLVEFHETGRDVAVHSETPGKYARSHEETIVFSAGIKLALDRLPNEIFLWASRSYSTLQVGSYVGDILSDYRSRVESSLANLGLTAHFDAISNGMSSDNPQDWRQAMYGIRDILRDLANQLWLVEGETYPLLFNDQKKPIRVTQNEYVNRIWAYLHQKGVRGATGEYLRAEFRRIHKLDDLASSAKGGVTRDELQLAVVAMYAVIGEVVTRTDMLPVLEIREGDN